MKFRRFASLLLAVLTVTGCAALPSFATATGVTRADYTAEELDSTSYDLRKYTLPFWEGNIVYNEILLPETDADGTLSPFSLMYEIDEVVSVMDNTLKIKYEENVDYRVVDGKLEIIPTGSIVICDYSLIHPASLEDESGYYPRKDGGYEYFMGDLFSRGISVTYIHNDTWDYPVPDSIEADLPGTMAKLMHKKAMTVVVAGDSVSAGASSSRSQGSSPFADAYPEMTVNALKEKFGNENIKIINSAIGGTMSEYTNEKLDNTIIQYSPDLVILNFGMNDSSCDRVGIPAEEFHDNMEGQIKYIKKRLPDCEIILLSSLYGNPYTFIPEMYEAHAAELHKLAEAYDGVAVCDPQAIMKGLLDTKAYVDFMNDNIVHPHDYGMRLMAQTIVAAIDVSDMDTYRAILMDDLTAHISPDSHVEDGKKEELTSLIDETAAKIAALDEEWDINDVMRDAYRRADAILIRCADGEHVLEDTTVAPTCKDAGYVHSICTVCGYEYDHDFTDAIGGEHIMDSGRQTTSPTYKNAGVFTSTCIRCGYEKCETVPMLADVPESDEYGGFMHIVNGYNYMEAKVKPYQKGGGVVSVDVCPLEIDETAGNPYVGVWIAGYSITACYNFREQMVSIIRTDLPFSGSYTPFVEVPFVWTVDSGENDYNWKRFSVKVEGDTVSIYIDGELIIKDTNEAYFTENEVMLVYSIGEFYLDNFLAGNADYDPADGSGSVIMSWDFDTTESRASFSRNWGLGGYTDTDFANANAATFSTGHNIHEHDCVYLNTVESTCSLGGYTEGMCKICGQIVRYDYTNPTRENGHELTSRTVVQDASDADDGLCTYECKNCDMRFTEVIAPGSSVTDVGGADNGERKFDGAAIAITAAVIVVAGIVICLGVRKVKKQRAEK